MVVPVTSMDVGHHATRPLTWRNALFTDFSRFIERNDPQPLPYEPLWPELPKGETQTGPHITEQWIQERKRWNEE